MYLGNGRMVQAPHTGARVQVVATSLPAYSREYAGSRRYYSP
jgi:cell wall-associated NlpC family hydrolase